MKQFKIDYPLVLILLCAAVVRFWGIGFGLPNTNCRPDEEQIVEIVNTSGQCFNPGWFNYPSFYKYLNLFFYGLYFIFGLLTGKYRSLPDFFCEINATNYSYLYLIDRYLSASLGVATVFVCYKIAKRLFDRKTGLISAFFLSFVYLHVRDSHFGTVDIPMVFFIMCATFFIIKCYQESSTRNYIFSGIFAGLAFSTKYPGILTIIPMVIANGLSISLTEGKNRVFVYPLVSAKRILVFMGIFTAVFLLGTPYAVFDFHAFFRDCVDVLKRYDNGEGVMLGRGWLYYLRFSLPLGMSFNLFVASLAGIMVFMRIDFRKALIFCSFPLAYYIIAGEGRGVFVRYSLPFIPYFCITAAVFVVYHVRLLEKRLSPNLNRAVLLILSALIILPSFYNVLHFDSLFSRKDNRLIVTEWVNKNIPDGSAAALFDADYGLQLPPEKIILADITQLPKYAIVAEFPVEIMVPPAPESLDIIQKEYRLLAEFKAIDHNKANRFDQLDNFYVPFAGFKDVRRPGPNYYIYEKKQ
jgi:hypothetical protein